MQLDQTIPGGSNGGARIDVVLDDRHYLSIDTITKVDADHRAPSLVLDGVYVPCGADVAGIMYVDVEAAHWSVDADFSNCAQSIVAKLEGSVAR